jgi:hypothetical protein
VLAEAIEAPGATTVTAAKRAATKPRIFEIFT